MRVILPSIVCVLSSLAIGAEDAATADKQVQDFLGNPVIALLRNADKVECFRVSPEYSPKAKEAIQGYPVIGKGKDQDALFAGKLASQLLNPGTYLFGDRKKCEFSPGVAFRVWHEKTCADVLICFSCDELEVISTVPGQDKPKIAHEDCDGARAELLKLAKVAFPDDKVIQGLKEKKGE